MTGAEDADDLGFALLALMRRAMDIELVPGECADCAGLGEIPDIVASAATDRGIWKTCPTCRGGRVGGNA